MMSPIMSQQPSQHSGEYRQYNELRGGKKGITATEEAAEYR